MPRYVVVVLKNMRLPRNDAGVHFPGIYIILLIKKKQSYV